MVFKKVVEEVVVTWHISRLGDGFPLNMLFKWEGAVWMISNGLQSFSPACQWVQHLC